MHARKTGHFRTRAFKREPQNGVVTKADEKTAAAVNITVTESNLHLRQSLLSVTYMSSACKCFWDETFEKLQKQEDRDRIGKT